MLFFLNPLKNFIKGIKAFIKERSLLALLKGIFSLSFYGPLIVGYYLALNVLRLTVVESLLLISFVLVIIFLITTIIFYALEVSYRKKHFILNGVVYVVALLYLLVANFATNTINSLVDGLNEITDDTEIVSTTFITASDDMNEVSDMNGMVVGLLDDLNSQTGYILPKKFFEKEEIEPSETIYYDSYISMIHALEENEVDFIAIPGGYETQFSDFLQNTEMNYHEIHTYSIKIEKETTPTVDIDLGTEPFNVLLIGVDARENQSINNTNADSLILINYNPQTLKMDIVSIPRDTYAPMACRRNVEDKITHSNWGGSSCVVASVEKLLGLDIDYYLKGNFHALIDIIDALGGIWVNVEEDFCGATLRVEPICIESGYQKLNALEALAFARNRNYEDGDVDRSRNQQEVIVAMLKELASINGVTKIGEIMNSISHHIDTNFRIDDIKELYNYGKSLILGSDYSDLGGVTINKYVLSGYPVNIFAKSVGFELYYFVPFQESINHLREALALTKLESVPDYPFSDTSFDVAVNYDYVFEARLFEYNETRRTFPGPILYPNFVTESYTLEMVEEWASEKGVSVFANEIYDEWIESGKVSYQEIEAGEPVWNRTLELHVSISKGQDPDFIPGFVTIPVMNGWTKEELLEWSRDNVIKVRTLGTYDPILEEGYVLKAKNEGDSVEQRETISVFVSLGVSPEYKLADNLLNLDEEYIEELIKELEEYKPNNEVDFADVRVIYESDSNIDSGKIVSVFGESINDVYTGGEILRFNDIINFVVSRGKGYVVPLDILDKDEAFLDSIKDELDELGINMQIVYIKDDTVPVGKVLEVSVAPGQILVYGEVMKVFVSSEEVEEHSD